MIANATSILEALQTPGIYDILVCSKGGDVESVNDYNSTQNSNNACSGASGAVVVFQNVVLQGNDTSVDGAIINLTPSGSDTLVELYYPQQAYDSTITLTGATSTTEGGPNNGNSAPGTVSGQFTTPFPRQLNGTVDPLTVLYSSGNPGISPFPNPLVDPGASIPLLGPFSGATMPTDFVNTQYNGQDIGLGAPGPDDMSQNANGGGSGGPAGIWAVRVADLS